MTLLTTLIVAWKSELGSGGKGWWGRKIEGMVYGDCENVGYKIGYGDPDQDTVRSILGGAYGVSR